MGLNIFKKVALSHKLEMYVNILCGLYIYMCKLELYSGSFRKTVILYIFEVCVDSFDWKLFE